MRLVAVCEGRGQLREHGGRFVQVQFEVLRLWCGGAAMGKGLEHESG